MGGQYGREWSRRSRAGDLQQATRAEARRTRQETRGDVPSQLRLLLKRLKNENLITDADAESVQRLFAVSGEARAGKQAVHDAYFQSREIQSMQASGQAGPVALAIASSTVGSYSINPGTDGSDTVVMAAANNRWATVGSAVGAAIGGRLLGEGGAALGASSWRRDRRRRRRVPGRLTRQRTNGGREGELAHLEDDLACYPGPGSRPATVPALRSVQASPRY